MRCIGIIPIIIVTIVNLDSQVPSPPELIFEDEVRVNSQLNEESRLQGFNLVNITSKDCDHDKYWAILSRLKERIIETEINEDTFNIVIGTIAECCRNFQGEIQVRNDTINLLYTEFGNICQCICYYQIEFQILIDKENFKTSDYQFMLKNKEIEISQEEYKTYPIKYETYLGDTVNFVDKYGMNQGYWILKDSIGRIKLEGNYKNDKDKYYRGVYSGYIGRSRIEYFENTDKIRIEEFRIGYEKIISRIYFEDGHLKNECIYKDKNNLLTCREWDSNGNLKKE